VVNGTMNVTNGANFTHSSTYGSSALQVGAGGHLTASNSTFAWSSMTLANGSILNSGDLTANGFDLPISVPAIDAPLLANNRRFQDVDILPGSLTSGQSVTLTPLGTDTTVNQRYVFNAATGTFTVQAGATLNVNGAAMFAAETSYTTFGIVVNGTMNVTNGANFTHSSTYGSSALQVGAGGHLTASNSTFAWDQLSLANGSILNSGDLTANGFDQTISVPAIDAPLLANNRRFQDVDLLGGSLASGQSLTLSLLGTDTTVNQRYVFTGAYTVQSGATMNVAANVIALIQGSQTITDNGTLTFGAGDAVSFASANATQIVVGSGGVLTLSGTAFSGSTSYTTQIVINSGGQLTANNSTFSLYNVTLNSGSADTLQLDTFSSQLAINSGASFTINQNDLSNVPASGVIATGNPNATINLTNNYWGTTVASQIAAKIKDHTTDTTRPTVLYQPYMTLQPAQTTASATNVVYNTAAQNVTLSATVISPSGVISQGTETFTVLSGSTVIGNAVTVKVSSGAASATYGLPAALAPATYTIQAVYNGTSFFSSATDTSQLLTVSAAAATTAAANASVTFNSASQNASLSATVTSSGGTVSEGTETFTILSGSTVIGSPVTVSVSSGAASASYTLPAGTAGGTDTIKAVYNGTVNFGASTDTGHTLTINAAGTTTASSNVSAAYNVASQSVGLSASVTSSAGTVSEGTETFTILSGSTVIGNSVTVSVSSGAASANYTLPGGTAAATYTIQAVYNGTGNYGGSTDSSHSLTVNTVGTSTAAGNTSATYSAASQSVALSATVTSGAGTVSEGTETFTILNGSTVIGNSVSGSVSSGAASVNYTLPAGLAPATYTIQAVYNGSGNLVGATDTSHSLTVNAAAHASVSVSLDSNSDSGAPDYPGYTNDTTPTFDVQVNQAGAISVDFDGNSSHDQSLSVSTAGTYQFTAPSLADGAYTTTASFDASLSGTAQNTTNYTIDTVRPQAAAMTPSGTVNTTVSQVAITFSEPVDLKTFSPSAITLTGPGGTIGVNQPQLVSGSTYNIGFATQTAQGSYTLTIATSVTDFAGNALSQTFSNSFTIALPDLAVTSTSAPSSAAEGASIPISWQVGDVSPTNGTGATWTDAVYVSANSVLDSSAVPLTSIAGPTSPLAPGSSYSRNTSVTIPGNLATGNYYLLLVADDNGGQLESDAGNDTNDVAADAITLSAPDLQVTGVSGPTTGITGQSVLVSWSDENTGTATATGPWVDNVYTGTDANGDNPTLLGSFTFDGSLAVGASVQRTQQVILPQTAGTQWFLVTTNATQTVPEGSNYGNDTTVSAGSTKITAVPVPDLVVSGITPPANGVFSGNSVPVSFVVKNQGQAATSARTWQDWVILSQDPNLGQTYQGQLNATGPGGDQTLNNQPVVLGFNNPSYLGVGESYQQNVSVPLPISAQGTWYVYVVPDGTGAHHPFAMPEASRTDKLAVSAGFSVTLSPPPDLAVSGVQAPAQDFSGQPMKLSWTVSNNGTGPTVASAWTDAVYMSPDASLDAKATLLATFAHQGVLAAGASYTNSETVNLPVGVSGSYYFLVKTDLNGQVFENGATANNVAATSAAETVNLTPPPDLTVSSISAPATALAGHGLTFSYTVTNAGAGATPNYTWNDALYLSPTATFHSDTAISLGQQNHQGSLAAGAGYTNTVTATLPNGLAGSYYVVVNTDSGNAVFELNKTNNTGVSTGATVVSEAPADLVVSSASAPAAALPGSAILVNWTVANQSTGDTGVSSWKDSVYVDTGTKLDGNAVLLGSFKHNGLVSGGGSYTQSQLLTLSIYLLGNYNLFVVANSAGDVFESNTSNNTSGPLPITISLQLSGGGGGGGGGGNNGGSGGGNGGGGGGGSGGGGSQQAQVSDLQPTAVAGPATVVTGGNVTVNWTVQNNGPGATNANYWNDDVWMSTNTTLGSGGTDVYLGTVQHTNPLANGASYSTSGTFALPNDMTAGQYYFLVATDRPVAPPGHTEGVNLVYETNETNNELAASSTTAVAVGSTPDLTVSGVTAPTTATAGQQLAVSWTVTNNGAATGTVPITDSVYLSYDKVLDPTDRYLGSVTYQGGLAGGATYTQNASIALPSGVTGTFYVFVVTNSDKSIFEQNTTDDSAYGSQTVQIQLAPIADLVAGTVTTPATAVAGQNITVTYQVTNNGGQPANGSWSDALYLSPTPTWNVSDPLLGTVSQTQDLAPGDSYTGTLTAPLPGVAPGSYYAILRANILDNLAEQTLSNNLSVSLTQTMIDAPGLTLGKAANGTLSQGQSAYWKVVVSEGQTLQIGLTGKDATAYNELYVSFGTMPTRSQYDYRYSQPFAASQQITIPTTQAGAYYILAYGDDVPSAPEGYSIEAAVIPFSIQAVTPGQAGAGPVTLQISGAQFDFATSFQLRNAQGTVIDATRTLLQDSATAYATFDLTGRPQESYDVWAVQSNGTQTELAAALSVAAPTPSNQVQIGLIVPQAVLVGRPGSVTVTYSNPGNTDVPAPLILLDGQNALFQVPGETGYSGSSLQLYGFNPAGPFGTLPPGFQGSITVSFKPVTAGAGIASDFTLQTLQDPNEPFDWNAFAANDVPSNTSPQQWAAMVSQAASLMGGTWGDVVSFIGNNSVQLLANAASQVNPNATDSLYNFDGLLQYAVGVYGSTMPASATPSFPVVASQGDITIYNANLDGSGKALPLNASYPTFVIIPGLGGYQAGFGTLAAAIAADQSDFPNGQVNVLVATWAGAAAGPTIDGVQVPWVAALHVATDGAELGDLLGTLDQQGAIGISTTTVIAAGLGNDVGDQAAQVAGGLNNAIALNPSSPLSGYVPPRLVAYFQHSTAYETSSFLDAQLSLAASNQTIPTGDINNPILQHTSGVPWLTGQILEGNGSLLNPSSTSGPDALPAANAPSSLASPATVTVSSSEVEQIISHDPNSIIGPKGSGAAGIVPIKQPMPYTIQFTNVATAQAPAQQVVVQQKIDPPNLDWRTFRLTSFGFAGQTYSIPANSAFYQTTIDLAGIDVQFTATIDESTGLATWTFTSVDPTTGQVPLNPTVGLLPPDVSNGIGEGYVSYTILPAATDPTGTVISAQATVTFDTQPPLATPEIFNTIDAGTSLTSSVTALPAFENSTQFGVSWSGSDASNGSAVSTYTIYVSDNGGPYTAWLSDTPLTSAPFVGRDGHTYGFYSVATDNAGNVQPAPGTSQATTAVDVTPPVTTALSSPAAGGSYNAAGWAGTIAGSATDSFSGVQQERVSILDKATNKFWDGTSFSSSTEVFQTAILAKPGATSTTWSVSFPESNFPADGSYVVHAVAGDEAGNGESPGLSATFNYDTTPPVTSDVLSGTAGNNGWFRSAVKVTLSAEDATSGVASTYYTIDGGSQQTYGGSAFSVSGEGSHKIAFWSVDLAGNTEAAESDSFKIDSDKPSTTDSLSGTHGKNGWFTSASVSVTLTASDATSGVAATYYTIDGGSQQTYAGSAFTVSGDASHTIAFWSVDVAGNTESAESDSVNIDTVKPHTSDSLSGTQGSNDWFTSASVSVTLTPSDATSGVAATYYTVDGGGQQTYGGSAFSVSGEGSHKITFWSVDVAGNTEAAESDSFKIDSVAPATTDSPSGTLGSNGWYTSASVSVSLSPSDATSGVSATYYTIDGGSQHTYAGSAFAVSGEGSHKITFWSVDVAGNTEAANSDSIKIDSVKPTTTDNLDSTGWYTSASVSVTLTASDATSGVAATYYTVDGGSQQTYGGSAFSISGEGTHHIVFWSVDVAGNAETPESDSFKIDSVKPTTTDSLSGTQGSNGWFTSSSVSVTLTASDAGSGVAASFYIIDGGSSHIYTDSPFSVSGEGPHHIVFWSVDVAGNAESARSDNFKIDSVKPQTTDSLSGTHGQNGWYTSASVSVTLTASDATSGVAATYYTIDGGSQQTYTGSAFSVSGDASHTIAFWSVDVAGNTESAETDSVNIDTVKPHTSDSLSGTQGSNDWFTSASVSVTLTPSDATSGVAATYYTVDGGGQQTYGGSAFSVSGEGSHKITFWSVDVAGNTEAAESDSFKIDSVAPQTTDSLSGTHGKNGWYTSASVSVSLTPTDATSGVAATYYTIDGGSQQTYAGSAFSITGEGSHKITFWSVDQAGNTEAAESDSFKIDSLAPTSAVSALPADTNSATFTVGWAGSDGQNGSGIATYTVYVSDNGGTFKPFQQNTTATSDPFTGQDGHTYAFYSLAADNAGNVQTVAGPSHSITVVFPASQLVVQAPSQDVAGGTFTVTVKAQNADGFTDPLYNGSVALLLSSGPSGGTLSGTTVAAVQNGVATFNNVSLNLVGGGYKLFAASTTDLFTATSSPITVVPTTHFSITGTQLPVPSTLTAGGSFTITITALTAAKTTDTSYAGTVRLTSTDPQAGYPNGQNVTLTAGRATATITLKTAGTQTVTAADITKPSDSGTSSAVTVSAAAASQLQVTAYPSPDLSGASHPFTVTALDPYNNVATTFRDMVTLSSSDPQAVLPVRSYTFTSLDNGSHTTFSATLATLGTQSLTATDTSNTKIPAASQSGISVQTATTHFSISGLPSTLTAGGSFTIIITALTAANSLDKTYAGTVQLSSTDLQAVFLVGGQVTRQLTFTAGTGTATATVTLKTAGQQTVSAADTTLATRSGTSSAVTVSAAAASQLQVMAYPSPDVSGASHNFTVTALDPYNNVATTFRDKVALSSSDPLRILPVTSYTFTSLDNGSHTTFSATLATLGTQSLTATDTSNTKIPAASQSGISVQTATTHFSISGLPSTLTAGGSFTIIITALTAANSLDKTYAGTVQLSSTDLQAVFLVGGQVTRQLTFTAGTGTATATVTLKTAGQQTVSAADTTLATRSGTSSAVTVSAAAASQLQVMAYPSPDVSGVSHSFTVTALDPYNNVATTFRDKVALSSSDPSRILPVTSYTFTSLDNGQHPFSATLATLGTQSLTATDTSNAKVPAASQSGISVVNFTAGITPTSPATVPVLAVPGQPLTFALSASETGQAATTSFTYTVNWGDGTATKPDTQLVSGVSGTPVSHVYTTTGNFLAAVTAADAAGNVTPKAATVAAILSTVALEADPGDTTKTALFVGGTIGNDTISIVPTNAAGTSVSVKVNGVVQTIGAATTFAPTGHILVYGQAGNDTIQETAATINKQSVPVAVPALIFAGSGNDTLSVAGSSANNLLVGASGNDSLTGGAGRDILIGGNGASVLRAGTGGDILIPGSTSYTPTVGGVYNPNVPALLSLLAEWGRNTSYSARVQDLFAGASGDLNGGSLLNPSTVSLSAALDQLFAGSALDWLWFADNAKVVHQVSNLPSGGIATFE